VSIILEILKFGVKTGVAVVALVVLSAVCVTAVWLMAVVGYITVNFLNSLLPV
jgi:hypothetical protein